MKMQSRPGFIDIGEEIAWIATRSRKLGEPIPVDVVRKVLCLEVEFQVLTGNAAIEDPNCDHQSILCAGDDIAGNGEDLLCPSCMLGLQSTPDD